jgi:hypothetical protein
MGSLFESRKFKVLMIAAALMGVPIVVVGVALITGHATYEQFVESSKWAVGSVSAVASAFMLAVGYEDGKAKGAVQPINNSGDNVQITTMKPPNDPSGGGPTTMVSIPPNPAPSDVSVAPMAMPIRSPLRRAWLPLFALATWLGFIMLIGACAGGWTNTKTGDLASIAACVLKSYDPAQPLDAQLQSIGLHCGIANATQIVDLISAHKAAMKREGEKLGAGAHNPDDPTKILP